MAVALDLALSSKNEKNRETNAEYTRHGTTNIFLAFEPLAGQRYTTVTDQRTKSDWASFIKELVDTIYPQAIKIRLVLDNLHTHNTSSLYEAFEPAEAKRIADTLAIHYMPKHGRWLNMAEIELSHLSRQCLADCIEDKATLCAEVHAWNSKRNARNAKAHWQFTTEDARVKLHRLYPIIPT